MVPCRGGGVLQDSRFRGTVRAFEVDAVGMLSHVDPVIENAEP